MLYIFWIYSLYYYVLVKCALAREAHMDTQLIILFCCNYPILCNIYLEWIHFTIMYWTGRMCLTIHGGKIQENPEKSWKLFMQFVLFFLCHACFVLIIACDFCRNLIQLSKSINPTHEFRFMYMPYLCHYKPRLVYIFFTQFFHCGL